MSELFKELQDDIRRERYDKLWHSFGRVMVVVSLVVIAATIATVIWQNHVQSKAMEKTSEFIKGIDRLNIEDYKGAVPVFDKLASDTSSSYYGLAMLRKAQAQNALSDHENAYKTYHELAEHDPVFGALARMMLPPVAGDVPKPMAKSVFFYAQSEMRGWRLLEAGKKDNAIAQFMALYRDKKTPSSMRGRVTEALQYLAPERLQEDTSEGKEKSHDEPTAEPAKENESGNE
jgi:hypothetical protein